MNELQAGSRDALFVEISSTRKIYKGFSGNDIFNIDFNC